MEIVCDFELMTRKDDIQAAPGRQTWAAPRIAFCRARRFGFSDVVFCLMEDGHTCGFAVRLGQGVFCRHPEREKIIAQTTANIP